MAKKQRIFIGLVEVAGRNAALKAGFESLGHEVTFVNLNVVNTRDPFWIRWIQRLGIRRRANKLAGYCMMPVEVLLRFILFFTLLPKMDVFIFSFNSTFFLYWDYRIIRLLKKKIVCQFHGSDSRPPYMDGAHLMSIGYDYERCLRDTRQKKNLIRLLDRLADVVIDIPPQGYFHERKYVLRQTVGLPSLSDEEVSDVCRGLSLKNSRTIRVLHAPSGDYKGTVRIRKVIENLKSKSISFEYREISGVSRRQVLEEIAQADLIIDQLYTDYALPGLASECCWFKKTVISSGNAVEFWRQLLGPNKTPPVIYVPEDQFELKLESLLTHPDVLSQTGQESYEYVKKYYSQKTVAQNYLDVILGKTVETSLFDPFTQTSWVGGFFSDTVEMKKFLIEYRKRFGEAAFFLDDKPKVKKDLERWLDLNQ